MLPRPGGAVSARDSALAVLIVENPFSFAVVRKSNHEAIFNTSGSDLIFESQYLRLRTSLPPNPVLYGLGEHTDPMMLLTTDYTRTFWSRDAGMVPPGTNLYGNHPVYFEHRVKSNATHAVAFINSNGMDIKINNTKESGQYLEYNTVGGIVDLYFLSGPGPIEVARQFTGVSGKPAMMPYWGFGFHQCRFGYGNIDNVAEVVRSYAKAKIPLETMWTDIDYMDGFKVFTLNPESFPLDKTRELVDYLHAHDQHYVMMVDPAVAYQDYPAFNEGKEEGIFMKTANGSIYRGVVWPGVTAYPDWFHDKAQAYWNGQFGSFFNESTGVDIDALWIDMNEPSNFCDYPCNPPEEFVTATEPLDPIIPANVANAQKLISEFGVDSRHSERGISKRGKSDKMKGLPGRDLINPKYSISNLGGSLSNHTVPTDLIHANGLAEYDTHNLYGTMMSATSRGAMLSRRPTKRPLIITRSTFMGAGAKVGHWLGDNVSDWGNYRRSIRHMLQFASFFQVPMVGADVCGFVGDTTETLCARWATLGAFYTFYRNHNNPWPAVGQEFYQWPMVAEAARNAINTRYRLLDYIYTAFHKQTADGTPVLLPMIFLYPSDPETFPIHLQYFYGPSLLISPVTEKGSTEVTIYLPSDQFYDFHTLKPISGNGSYITLTNISYTEIPVHIRGGSILPLRVRGANTTTALRKLDFELLVAPDGHGQARGELYLDDGESLVQEATSEIEFWFDGKMKVLEMNGTFGYNAGVRIGNLTILGEKGPVICVLNKTLKGGFTVDIKEKCASV